jgi:synaptobrevin family protein YKT6
MGIYFIGIYYKLNNSNAFHVFSYYNLEHISYFKRSYAKEFIRLLAREFIKSHDTNETFLTMDHVNLNYNYKINMLTEDNKYYYVIITNINYNIKLARYILCEIANEFKKLILLIQIPKYITNDMNIQHQNLTTLIDKYSNPTQDEKIIRITNELENLTQIMKNNIDKVLVRDLKINELLEKTNNLSIQSNEFKKSASKLNKCCGWW